MIKEVKMYTLACDRCEAEAYEEFMHHCLYTQTNFPSFSSRSPSNR